VVSEVAQVIAERYVLPERRPALDAVLAEGLSSGRYRVTDPRQLATLINADLERVGKDKHLSFATIPSRPPCRRARAGRRARQCEYERMVAARNHGIMELKVLPGNVRYMDYRGFDWIGPDTAAALDNAMSFLAGGDAVIIDIRRNGGGSPAAVQYITSHFMEAGKPLMTFHMNGKASPDTTATLAEIKAPRMIGKPLYVLTSGGSASAAEEFAGHVGGYKFGELVGENTAGAGFRNELVPVAGDFVISVSVGRAVLAATGKDWEAVGHAPRHGGPVRGAGRCQSHALRRLARGTERARADAVAWPRACRRPSGAPRAAAGRLCGQYGERHQLDGDRLVYQRGACGSGDRAGRPRFAFEEDPAFVVVRARRVAVAAMESDPAAAAGRYERTRRAASVAGGR
jgi:hypothetical protein